MNEAQRQRYLKAMGLTPWVARSALPGAAPSPELDWEQETDGAPAQVATGTPVASPQRPAGYQDPSARRTPDAGNVTGEPAGPTPATPGKPAPERAAPDPAVAGDALIFTLESHLAGDTWVVFQQEEAQAPGLGRYTGALAAALLAVFEATPSRPRRFYCPLTEQPMGAEQAVEALQAFLGGLVRRGGGRRVLLCLEEPLAGALFEGERYQPFPLGDLTALVVSSLSEMLADPPRHKRRSWQAMQAGGFDRRHE